MECGAKHRFHFRSTASHPPELKSTKPALETARLVNPRRNRREEILNFFSARNTPTNQNLLTSFPTIFDEWPRRLISIVSMAIELPSSNPHSLPRLDATCYQADAAVLWTFTTFDRAKLSLDHRFHSALRELLIHTCVRAHVFCPAYVLMPDHLHFVWIGTHPSSDQLNAMRFLRTHLSRIIEPLRLQPQPHDHVFTTEERTRNAFASACRYVLLNPVRAKLIQEPQSWPFCGSILPAYPDIDPFADSFWPTFWKIFAKHRHPDCGKHRIVRRLYSKKS